VSLSPDIVNGAAAAAASVGATTTTTTTTTAPTSAPQPPEPEAVDDEASYLNIVAALDSCEHVIHDACIRSWAQKTNTCPICRTPFHSVRVYNGLDGKLVAPPPPPLPHHHHSSTITSTAATSTSSSLFLHTITMY
jgi:hypothetical protein